MKIRLLTSLAGVKSYAYGDVLTAGIEVSENDVVRLVERHLAEPVTDDNAVATSATVAATGASPRRGRQAKAGVGADGR